MVGGRRSEGHTSLHPASAPGVAPVVSRAHLRSPYRYRGGSAARAMRAPATPLLACVMGQTLCGFSGKIRRHEPLAASHAPGVEISPGPPEVCRMAACPRGCAEPAGGSDSRQFTSHIVGSAVFHVGTLQARQCQEADLFCGGWPAEDGTNGGGTLPPIDAIHAGITRSSRASCAREGRSFVTPADTILPSEPGRPQPLIPPPPMASMRATRHPRHVRRPSHRRKGAQQRATNGSPSTARYEPSTAPLPHRAAHIGATRHEGRTSPLKTGKCAASRLG